MRITKKQFILNNYSKLSEWHHIEVAPKALDDELPDLFNKFCEGATFDELKKILKQINGEKIY